MSEPQPAEAPEPEPPALTEPGRMSEPQPAEAPEPEAAPASVPDGVTESRAQSVSATGDEFAAESESAPEIVPDPSLSVEPAETYDRSSLPEPRRPRRSGGWSVWIFAAALGLCAYALIATGTLERLVQALGPGSKPAPAGTIDVTVTPEDAQIFVYVGRGPAVAHGMAVPSAHEFIVFDEGLKPSRAIVPQDATWTTTDGGPLYELAVQAHVLGDPSDVFDLGAPQVEASPDTRGGTGTIRVITNPPGAKVYRYIGAGPSARIRVPSIHEGQEVLVHREAFETTRAVIGPSDWKVTAGESTHRATLRVELPALAKSAAPGPIEN